MGDSPSDKKPAIPAWQRAQAPSSTPDPAPAGAEESTPHPPSSGAPSEPADEQTSEPQPAAQDAGAQRKDPVPLLHQARKFLQDPSIRDASEERIYSFLRSKGMADDDIKKVLDEVEKEQRDSPPSATAPKPSPTQPVQPASSSKSDSLSQHAPRAAPRDIPPIITYPEFLTQPTSPPPLITIGRILKTIYAVAGAAAVTYGVSTFLVTPMTEQLTEARHDFASHTQSQLDKLNEKLEGMVSSVPKLGSDGKKIVPEQQKETISDEDSDEDPTELYHRDFGTQTSPDLSRRGSMESSGSDSPKTPATSTAKQTSQLEKLTQELRSLSYGTRGNTTQDDAVHAQVGELKNYLNEMAYSSPYFGSDIYGARYGTWKKPGEDDAIEAFKADIRSVKGVFLSARNFPSSQNRARGSGR